MEVLRVALRAAAERRRRRACSRRTGGSADAASSGRRAASAAATCRPARRAAAARRRRPRARPRARSCRRTPTAPPAPLLARRQHLPRALEGRAHAAVLGALLALVAAVEHVERALELVRRSRPPAAAAPSARRAGSPAAGRRPRAPARRSAAPAARASKSGPRRRSAAATNSRAASLASSSCGPRLRRRQREPAQRQQPLARDAQPHARRRADRQARRGIEQSLDQPRQLGRGARRCRARAAPAATRRCSQTQRERILLRRAAPAQLGGDAGHDLRAVVQVVERDPVARRRRSAARAGAAPCFSRLLLPTPPGPVTVSSRHSSRASSAASSRSSRARPTKPSAVGCGRAAGCAQLGWPRAATARRRAPRRAGARRRGRCRAARRTRPARAARRAARRPRPRRAGRRRAGGARRPRLRAARRASCASRARVSSCTRRACCARSASSQSVHAAFDEVVHAVEQLAAAQRERVGDAAFAQRLLEVVQVGGDDEAHDAGLRLERRRPRQRAREVQRLAQVRRRECGPLPGQNNAASSDRVTQPRRSARKHSNWQRRSAGSALRSAVLDTRAAEQVQISGMPLQRRGQRGD